MTYWGSSHATRWKAFKLKEKFKLLKSTFKIWSKGFFDNLDSKISVLSDDVRALDLVVDQ